MSPGASTVLGCQIVKPSRASSYPRAFQDFRDLRHYQAFKPDLATYGDKLGSPPFTIEDLSKEKRL